MILVLIIILHLLMTCITYKLARKCDKRKYTRGDVILTVMISNYWPVTFWVFLWVANDWKITQCIASWLNKETDW